MRQGDGFMDRGWFKWWRKTTESAVFQSTTPDLIKVWDWCLSRANHSERWVSIPVGRGSTEVRLQPGQFVYGRHSAARLIPGLSARQVDRRIKKLELLECITVKAGTHYSVVSICHWETYQDDGQPTVQPMVQQRGNKGAAKGQQTGTEKNEEKVETGKHGKKNVPQGGRADYPEDFEKWWKLYPKKKGKQGALKEFAVAKRSVSLDRLMERTAAFAKALQGADITFAKDPERWLKAGQYDDDPVVWSRIGRDANEEPEKVDTRPIKY